MSADANHLSCRSLADWPTHRLLLCACALVAGKSGADPEKVVDVVREIREKCKRLHFAGLMTIGRFDEHPEPDFRVRVAHVAPSCVCRVACVWS
jgi:uncharacterized pyridoxal phosphate-containing UPF0001 family protein